MSSLKGPIVTIRRGADCLYRASVDAAAAPLLSEEQRLMLKSSSESHNEIHDAARVAFPDSLIASE